MIETVTDTVAIIAQLVKFIHSFVLVVLYSSLIEKLKKLLYAYLRISTECTAFHRAEFKRSSKRERR
jgi:hypothetical protein